LSRGRFRLSERVVEVNRSQEKRREEQDKGRERERERERDSLAVRIENLPSQLRLRNAGYELDWGPCVALEGAIKISPALCKKTALVCA
jgi:hypothetical protein